jgi:hypothetical protein
MVYRPLNQIRPRFKRSPSEKDRPKSIKCFAYKGEYKWRNCPYIEENIKEIRGILVKARTERRNGKKITAKAYFIKDINISLDDSTLFINNKDIALKLSPRKSFITKWITDIGVLAYIINQLHLFKGPLKKMVRGFIKVKGDARLSIKEIKSA